MDRHASVRASPEKCDKLETDDRHKAQRHEVVWVQQEGKKRLRTDKERLKKNV